MTPDGAHADTLYSGNQITSTDQANKQRKRETDALGRLCKVWEDPAGLNYLASYSYDILDNLTTVTQGAQTRTFTYNSLGRQLSAANPESGTTTYTYDSLGNTLTKTDARTAKTTFAYDALNRQISRTYSGTTTEGINAANATSPVYYKYDNQAFPTGAPAGFNRGFAIGKLVAMTYGTSTASDGNYYGYDELGREVRKTQQLNGNNYPITASYNRASMILGQTYPSARITSYGYNVTGQLTNFSGNIGDGTTRNYVTSATYTAAGQKEREVYGTTTPLYLNLKYNKRQQMVDVRLSSTTDPVNWNRGALIFYYGTNAVNSWNPYVDDTDNNGNLHRAFHYVPLNDANTSSVTPQLADYFYDSLNRISSFTEAQNNGSAWNLGVDGQTFSYDQYGNRKITSTVGGVNGYNPTYTATNNRIAGLTYDSTGNITNDGVRTMTYDAENHMIGSTSAGGNGIYAYDGNSKRIKRTTNGQEWRYVYGMSDELIAEYLSTAPTTAVKEYGYREGQLLVVAEGSNVRWIVKDHLGSTRMTADSTGSLAGIKRQDYLPFGEDLYVGLRRNGANGQYGYEPPLSTIRQKFTGYQRDTESGLDYAQARYMSSMQGRFMSVDPENAGADPEDPHSWNGYAYARSNPGLFTDPDGRKYLVCPPGGGGGCEIITDDSFYHARRQDELSGFRYTGSRDFFEHGHVIYEGSDLQLWGSVLLTYEQISIDDDARKLSFYMRHELENPDTIRRAARNAIIGALLHASVPKQRVGVTTKSATRSAAFNEAKKANGVPTSQEPVRILKPNTDAGKAAGLDNRNVRMYEYINNKGEKVWIREDKAAFYPEGGVGDQNPHFNSGRAGESLPNHHEWE